MQHVEAGLGTDDIDDTVELVLNFDISNPNGKYTLNLSRPTDRWVAIKLRDLSLSRKEPWANAVWDSQVDTHFSRRATEPWSEHLELPDKGVLYLTYAERLQREQATVYYELDLSEESQREVAVQLLQRATNEPGENWVNETLNGEHFTLDEADHDWVLPTTGVLALDYVTFAAKYEAAYELDLSVPAQRAICIKLVERATTEPGENFVRPALDDEPLSISDLEEGLWRVPMKGMFTCHFVCTDPKHVSTRHYCLDLADEVDHELGEALLEWAVHEPGENWMNESLNGQPVHFNELRKILYSREDLHHAETRLHNEHHVLPRQGILEFDYVVLKPRVGLPISERVHRLDLTDDSDRKVAARLSELSYAYAGDTWLNQVLEQQPTGRRLSTAGSGRSSMDRQPTGRRLSTAGSGRVRHSSMDRTPGLPRTASKDSSGSGRHRLRKSSTDSKGSNSRLRRIGDSLASARRGHVDLVTGGTLAYHGPSIDFERLVAVIERAADEPERIEQLRNARAVFADQPVRTVLPVSFAQRAVLSFGVAPKDRATAIREIWPLLHGTEELAALLRLLPDTPFREALGAEICTRMVERARGEMHITDVVSHGPLAGFMPAPPTPALGRGCARCDGTSQGSQAGTPPARRTPAKADTRSVFSARPKLLYQRVTC